jgi:hypothetical protein
LSFWLNLSRKEHPVIGSKYIAMDVHQESISIAVMSASGKIVME